MVLLQGVPYVLGRTFESLGPIMLTFWFFLTKYGKKHTFQWLIWCYLLSRSCTFIKNTGENVQYYFATLLYNLVSRIKIVIQTYKKSLNDQKWDLNWIFGCLDQFWLLVALNIDLSSLMNIIIPHFYLNLKLFHGVFKFMYFGP